MLKGKKSRKKKKFSIKRDDGFTLIELIVAAALSLIVMTGIYSVYRSQSKSYIVREQITVMQQNLRAGMVVMTSDIRMAGYVHPFITPAATPGITEANSDSIKFTLLENKDADPDTTDADVNKLETIEYSLTDLDGNGVADLVKNREFDGTADDPLLIAQNIDALNFVYLKADGTITANPAEVKSVQLTMVARAGRGDPDYRDADINAEYKNQQGDIIFTPGEDDNFRRRILTREINCRNL